MIVMAQSPEHDLQIRGLLYSCGINTDVAEQDCLEALYELGASANDPMASLVRATRYQMGQTVKENAKSKRRRFRQLAQHDRIQTGRQLAEDLEQPYLPFDDCLTDLETRAAAFRRIKQSLTASEGAPS